MTTAPRKTRKTFTGRTVPLEGPKSLAFIQEPINLRTLRAVTVFRESFTLVELRLYLVSTITFIVARQKGLETQRIETVIAYIAALLNEEASFFAAKIAELTKITKHSRAPVPKVQFTHPAVGLAEYRTVEAGRFVTIIKQLDDACLLLQQAYFAGAVTMAQRLDEEFELQSRLRQLIGKIQPPMRQLISQILRGQPEVEPIANAGQDDASDDLDTDALSPDEEKLLKASESALSSTDKTEAGKTEAGEARLIAKV